MDETYVKVGSQWKYLYRAVDRDGNTVDFLLRTKRDHAAGRAFFERAVDLHGVPEKITIDKSAANTTAIVSIQADSGLPIELRQAKYLNNIVEQDHRAVKRITSPMLGFKTFRCVRTLITGIEGMHMIRKGHLSAGGLPWLATFGIAAHLPRSSTRSDSFASSQYCGEMMSQPTLPAAFNATDLAIMSP